MKTPAIGFVALIASASCVSTPAETVKERAPISVTLSRATAADLARPFEAGGVVRARATSMVASRVMATITEIHVRPGDRVRRGTRLVTLDARDTEANKKRADAASVSAAESARAAAADVLATDSAAVLARTDYERMATLHARHSATPQELDQAVARLREADAQHTGAEARLAAANAARDAAAASAEAAAVGLTYAVLSSPFDGIVTERLADPGTMASPGTPLLILEDPSSYRLEVQLDEARASLASIGQQVSVRLDNAPAEGEEWTAGRVAEIARVDPASHAFLVKIDLPASPQLRSGLFGRARFAGPAERTLEVPEAAVIKRGQLTFVYRVDADGRAHLRPISIGASIDDRVEVLAGLKDGDAIVTNPPASLIDGAPVIGNRP